jgi:hypothetical protein
MRIRKLVTRAVIVVAVSVAAVGLTGGVAGAIPPISDTPIETDVVVVAHP